MRLVSDIFSFIDSFLNLRALPPLDSFDSRIKPIREQVGGLEKLAFYPVEYSQGHLASYSAHSGSGC